MFLKKFDIFFLIQYGPSFTGTIFVSKNLPQDHIFTIFFQVLLSTFTIPYSTQLVAKFFNELKYWDLKNADPKVEENIKREARRINLYLILYLILVASSAVFNMIPNQDDVAMMHYFMIARTYFPRWENCFFWVFRFSYPMIGLIMISPYIQVLYCCKCFKFKSLLLLSALEEIEYGFEDSGDSGFQSEIKNKLIFCVKLYNNILTQIDSISYFAFLLFCFQRVSEDGQGYQVFDNIFCNDERLAYHLFALFFCLREYMTRLSETLFTCFQFQEMLSGKYLRFSTLTSASLILGLYLLYTCQDVEDVVSFVTGQNILTKIIFFQSLLRFSMF